jgi:uncharacterized membrane-anchored protein
MTPSAQVTAGAIGGAVAVVVVWIVTALTGLEVPAEVAVALGAIFSFIGGYIKGPS